MNVQITSLASSSSLVLGTTEPVSTGVADIYQSTGLLHQRNLTGLFEHPPLTTGSVVVSIQEQQYLSAPQSVSTAYPNSISAVLRTANAWVDRISVRVAYQLKDSRGNVVVTRPSAVVLRITHASQTLEFGCDRSGTQTGDRIAHCICTYLSSEWFQSSTVANVAVVLRNSGDTADAAIALLPDLLLHAQPSWWLATLRGPITGNGLTAPTGVSTGGIFITLPTSPLYANEEFD
eukprot:5724315-Prymnesium_polylepis.1